MSWLAVLLIGVGLADLVHSASPRHLRARLRGLMSALVAAVATVVCGLLAGLTGTGDLLALVLVAGAVVGWGWAVTRGFGRGPAVLPLVVLLALLVLAVGLAPWASPADGVLGAWLARDPLPVLDGVSADQFLLVTGAVLVQLSTGNVVVRLVLGATGTMAPVRHGAGTGPETRLKGGRLLGPMERVFILGLGLAGQLTAASIVVAAKGLLRFPELYTRSEQERVHQLTEYFLVGSFVSWLLALGGLALVG